MDLIFCSTKMIILYSLKSNMCDDIDQKINCCDNWAFICHGSIPAFIAHNNIKIDCNYSILISLNE